MPPPQTHIGISGWTYAPWRGVFYPSGWPHKRELEYCGKRFNSIEINGSFYSLQRPSSYAQWYAQTPPSFRFAVKGGRFVTHMKKLKDVRVPLANFLASGILRLGAKLGPLLWQFPPHLGFMEERFESFLAMLPKTHAEAAQLALEHDERVQGDRVWTRVVHEGPIRHAFEVRHPSFLDPRMVALLRKHGAALVFADTAGLWPYTEDICADFVYIRLHGAEHLYASGYTDSELAWWARRIRPWRDGGEPADARRVAPPAAPAAGRDVYVYFDNDAKVHAPFDAARLAEIIRAQDEMGVARRARSR